MLLSKTFAAKLNVVEVSVNSVSNVRIIGNMAEERVRRAESACIQRSHNGVLLGVGQAIQ